MAKTHQIKQNQRDETLPGGILLSTLPILCGGQIMCVALPPTRPRGICNRNKYY